MYKTIDPSTGALLREFSAHSDSDIERMLVTAEAAWGSWRFASFQQRSDLLERVGALLL